MTQRTFSIATLLGFTAGVGLFCLAIMKSTDNYIVFVSLNSFILVFGGTVASTMIAFHGRYVIRTLFSLLGILFPYYYSPRSITEEAEILIDWASTNRKEGVKGIERQVEALGIKDPLIRYGTELLSSGYKQDELRQMLTDFINSTFERKMVQSNILATMAGFSPGFGMIGTLVGLIIMLDKMSSDISQLGPGLAIALITTLYGILLGQLVFKPASEKIRQSLEIERYRNVIVIEGIMSLSENKSTIQIQDKLNSFIDPNNWIDMSKKNAPTQSETQQ